MDKISDHRPGYCKYEGGFDDRCMLGCNNSPQIYKISSVLFFEVRMVPLWHTGRKFQSNENNSEILWYSCYIVLQICPIPFHLFNLNSFVGGQRMNLTWFHSDPNKIVKTAYFATSRQQSDSNWDTSVFIYNTTANCVVDCYSEIVTLNFRFEVSSYIRLARRL